MTRKQRELSSKQQMDMRALDILSERTETFEAENADGKNITYTIYPLQLARLSLITRRLVELDLVMNDPDGDVVNEMWSICSEKPRQVAEIIAIATLRTKEDIETKLEERTNELLWSPTMTTRALANILYTIIYQSYYEDFMKAIRLVKIISVNISQRETEKRIATVATAFGGR